MTRVRLDPSAMVNGSARVGRLVEAMAETCTQVPAGFPFEMPTRVAEKAQNDMTEILHRALSDLESTGEFALRLAVGSGKLSDRSSGATGPHAASDAGGGASLESALERLAQIDSRLKSAQVRSPANLVGRAVAALKNLADATEPDATFGFRDTGSIGADRILERTLVALDPSMPSPQSDAFLTSRAESLLEVFVSTDSGEEVRRLFLLDGSSAAQIDFVDGRLNVVEVNSEEELAWMIVAFVAGGETGLEATLNLYRYDIGGIKMSASSMASIDNTRARDRIQFEGPLGAMRVSFDASSKKTLSVVPGEEDAATLIELAMESRLQPPVVPNSPTSPSISNWIRNVGDAEASAVFTIDNFGFVELAWKVAEGDADAWSTAMVEPELSASFRSVGQEPVHVSATTVGGGAAVRWQDSHKGVQIEAFSGEALGTLLSSLAQEEGELLVWTLLEDGNLAGHHRAAVAPSEVFEPESILSDLGFA